MAIHGAPTKTPISEAVTVIIEEQERKMLDFDIWMTLGVRNGSAACLLFESMALPNARMLKEAELSLHQELSKTIGIEPNLCKVLFRDAITIPVERDREHFPEALMEGVVCQRIHVRCYTHIEGFREKQFDDISEIVKKQVFEMCPAIEQLAISFDQIHLGQPTIKH